MDRERLAEHEEHFLIPSSVAGLHVFLRFLPAATSAEVRRGSVLYVHGATFPSALSIAHRFDGRSWRDELCDAGFDVWALDFQGFGHSDRYPEMDAPASDNEPLCLAHDATGQILAATHFILQHQNRASLSFISHSWGSMPLCRFAGEHPALVDRIVLFAPLARRDPPRYTTRPDGPAWRTIGIEDQWNRFIEDIPPNEPPVLSRVHFEAWAQRYLDTDPKSRERNPASVKIPSGPFVEILRAWHGELAYDPANVRAPVAIVRGAWDGLVTDADARWLFDALANAPVKRDIKIGRGSHLMLLETTRLALWNESIQFLEANDVAPMIP